MMEANLNDLKNDRCNRNFNVVDEKYEMFFINESWPELKNIHDSIKEKKESQQ